MTLAGYDNDIARIVAASKTDSRIQRDKLVTDLRGTPFVRSLPTTKGDAIWVRPAATVLATDRLKELLAGIPDAFIVDDRQECLRGNDVRELLELCGTTRHLRLVTAPEIDEKTKRALREKTGHPETSGQKDRIINQTLFGLENIIAKLGKIDLDSRRRHAKLLWQELALIADRRGKDVFTASYSWSHYGNYKAPFPATFIQTLNDTAWVPGPDGELYPPSAVVFEFLDWTHDSFLLDQIRFKPPIIAQLAEEAGFEPAALDLLKRLGLTSEAELRAKLGIKEASPPFRPAAADVRPSSANPNGTAAMPPADVGTSGASPEGNRAVGAPNPTSKTLGSAIGGSTAQSVQISSPALNQPGLQPQPTDNVTRSTLGGEIGSTGEHDTPAEQSVRSSRQVFISYVAVEHDGAATDPDGLEHTARMELEEAAISFILAQEPDWQRTPAGNPGYDLVRPAAGTEPCIWCEVKAMSGTLDHRPVSMSRTQFEFAQSKGANYFLYIVERAGSAQGNIVRIRDPAGHARNFTFDHGWRSVAVPASGAA